MKNKLDKNSLMGLGITFIVVGAGIAILLNIIGGLGLLGIGTAFLITGLKK